MTSAKAGSESVKDILKGAHQLLQPPGALPTKGDELKARLAASQGALSSFFDRDLVGISYDLLSDRGDEHAAGKGKLARSSKADGQIGEDVAGRMRLLVGLRSLDLLVGLQRQLIREFWPAEVRGGDARDFILGTADLRLLRLLIAQTMALLTSLSRGYLTTLLHSSGGPSRSPHLKSVLIALLSLLCPTPPPPSPGPSAPRHLPPTTITQLLSTSHLPPILLSAVLLGYTPSVGPATHAELRQTFISTLGYLPPSQALLSLSIALGLTKPSRPLTPTSISDHIEPEDPYPTYVSQAIQKQLSAQLLRPTAVRGLLINLFGERALSDAEPVDDKKVHHGIEMLRRIPTGVSESTYVRHVARECLGLLAPPKTGEGKQAPRAFRTVAGGVLGRWTDRSESGEVLEEVSIALRRREDEEGVSVQMGRGETLRALSTLDTLIGYTDPAHLPAILDIAVRPLLSELSDLVSPSGKADKKLEVVSDRIGMAEVQEAEQHTGGEAEEVDRVAELAGDIMEVWERVKSGNERYPASA